MKIANSTSRRILHLSIALVMLAGSAGPLVAQRISPVGSVNSEPQLPELVTWGRRDLSIPYRWSNTNEARSASEVVLFVSLNQGANWSKVSSATPQVRSFLYQAPSDGEFWFALRTYDRYGSYQPAGPLQAEMRVAIDTEGPRLAVLEGRIEQGTLKVDLEAHDAVGIDRSSIQLFAQPEGATTWTPIAVQPEQNQSADNKVVSARGQWRAPIGASRVRLRAVVSDSAGSRTESTAEAMLSSPSRSRPFEPSDSQYVQAPTHAAPQHTGTGPSLNQPQFAASSSKNPFDRFDAQWKDSNKEPFQFASTSPANTQSHGSRTGPVDRNPIDRNQSTASRGLLPVRKSQAWPVDRPTTQSLQAVAPRPVAVATAKPNSRSPFSQASLNKGYGYDSSNYDSLPKPDPMLGARTQLQSVDRFVNSREFEFDYQLQETGQWGVSRVELWGTQDNGATWRRYAIDSDNQSPIHVAVQEEGIYGFKILVESIGGLAPAAPRPRDKPEVSVQVDLQQPRVVLTRLEQGLGYLADQVTIGWRVDEEHPAKNGVDLYYSNRRTGPWAPIATNISTGSRGHIGMSGAGRYSWRLQRHLPERFYVRVEARDQAGNVGSAVSEQAIEVSVPSPSGALLGVRAVAE